MAHLAGLSLGADSDGAAVLTTNPAGERTLAIRDGLGRGVRSVQLAADNTALVSNTSTFDTMVNISGYGDVLETSSSNALGHTNKSRTDGAGRTLQSLDATSAITTFVYNANGQRLSVRDPNNVGQDCTYDPLGRDLSCTDTVGAVTSRTFDLAGQAKTQTDAKGKLTAMAYDSRGRRTTLTDRIAATTTWTFDPAGNELSMTDAENQTTVYGYDNSGRRTTIQWPDHVAGQTPGQSNYGIEATAYDAAGRAFRKTNQLGDTITSVYDMAGRTLSREYRTLANSPSGATGSVDGFTYDAASRLLAATSGQYANTVGRSYANGRLASESLTTDGQTYTTNLAYDFNVPKVTITYPNGTTVSRSLNTRGLLNTIQLGSTNLLTRTYGNGSRLSSQSFGNGITESMGYGNDNLPITRNTPVGNFSFGWDANKNKTSETITGTLSAYGWSTGTTGFDDQNRLVNRNQGSGSTQLNEAFTLSPVADMSTVTTNGVAQTRTHGPAHELLSIGGAAVVEDSRGNIVNDGLGNTFAWDDLGHLAAADTNGDNTADVTYAYDALRRRVKKTTGGEDGQSIIFVSLGHDLLADYTTGTAAASPLRNYVYTGRIDEPVAMIDYTTAGSLGAGVAETFYYHCDSNWHVRGMTNASGQVVEAYSYSSYGTPTILDPSSLTTRTSSIINNRWLFTAREWDQETQSYHFRYRTLLPRLARFANRDPVGYIDGAGLYASYFVPNSQDVFGLADRINPDDWYNNLWLPEVSKAICKDKGWGKGYGQTFRKTLDTGCIGVTFLTLGFPTPEVSQHHNNAKSYPFPDLSNCFRDKVRAEARLQEMENDHSCADCSGNTKPATNIYGNEPSPVLVAIAWWNLDRNGRPEVTIPANGDIANLNTCGNAIDSGNPIARRNYDFVCQSPVGDWFGADHMQGLGPNKEPMTMFRYDDSEIEAFMRQQITDDKYNTLHFCAVCQAKWDGPKPVPNVVPGLDKEKKK